MNRLARQRSAAAWLPALLVLGCQSRAGRAPGIAPAPAPILGPSSQLAKGPPPELLQVPLRLREVAAEAGLDYRWSLPERSTYDLQITLGHGAAFLDFDGDGWMDVLLAGPRPALYRNRGDGHFAKVPAALSALSPAPYVGLAVGDYDRDGFPDVFLSSFRGGLLLHNERGVRFRDVTRAAGLRLAGWSSAAAFADLDRDGQLDLIVGRYLDYDPQHRTLCERNGMKVECGPIVYPPLGPLVFRNLGDGRFRDVTQPWGFDRASGRTLGVLTADLDQDGQPEVLLANDLAPGDLFVRRADGRFENQGAASGTAFNRLGLLRAGMGVDVADYDLDGALDLVILGFSYQGASLFRSIGRLSYKDTAGDRGVKVATFPWVGFGARFADLDNDGWPDLFVTNGHVYKESQEAYHSSFLQPLLLLYNRQGTYYDLSGRLGGRAGERLLGRGLAAADYDRDGRMDLLAVDDSGQVLLLHNETAPAGHFLSVRLLDRGGMDALGATLLARVAGRPRVLSCHADGSYASASDPRLHLGLGAALTVPDLSVQWVSGRRERFAGPFPADRRIELREGTGQEPPPGP